MKLRKKENKGGGIDTIFDLNTCNSRKGMYFTHIPYMFLYALYGCKNSKKLNSSSPFLSNRKVSNSHQIFSKYR